MKARSALAAAFSFSAIVSMLFLAFPPPARAERMPAPAQFSAELTPQERTALRKNSVLTVITDGDMAPYGFADEQGRYIGVMPDIGARLEELLGIRIKFRPMSYADLVEHVRQGTAEAAMLVDAFDVPYEQHYLMTDEVLFMPYALFVRKDSDLATRQPESVSGKTIALITGWDLKNPSLDSLRGNRFVFCDTYMDCITFVLRGKADAFFDVHPMINYTLAKNFIKDLIPIKAYYEGYPAAFFVRRELPELYSALQKALGAISREERMGLLKKWNAFMDDAVSRLIVLDLGPEERKWLKDHPVIRVGIDANRAPLEFTDSDGHIQGISIDYLQQFEKMLGIRFDMMSGRPWHEYIDMAGRREIDMLSGAVETPGRAGRLAFTKPYIAVPLVILTRNDVPYVSGLKELEGKKVAVVKGYVAQEWLAKDFPGIELVPVASAEEMFRLLEKGLVHACVENLPTVGYYLGKPEHSSIKVSGQTPYTCQVSMAVRGDYGLFAGILQKAFNSIPADQRAAEHRKWMAVAHEPVPDYGLLWKVLLPLLLVLVIFAYWTWRLIREVGSRKLAEAKLRDAQTNLEKMNLDLESRVRQRTLDLEQATHTLLESEERFRSITENSPDAIIITDSSATMVYCNRAAERMFGYTQEELLGKPAAILLPPRLQAKEAMQRGEYDRTGESDFIGSTIESWAARKDGTELPIEFSIFSWEIDGVFFFATITRDISKRRQVEESLRSSEERFSKMAESIQDGLSIIEGGEIVYFNNRICEIMGCTREELPRLSRLEFVDPQDKERIRKIAEDARTTGTMPPELEYWILRRDGARRCIHNRYTTKRYEKGFVSRYVVTTDITERKQMEEALRDERKRLSGIVETSPVIICGISPNGTATFINRAGEGITGYSSQELIGLNWWQTFYPGELSAQVEELFSRLAQGDVINHEMTLKTKAGELRTILWNSITNYDSHGNVLEVFGFGNDITERKLAENEIRQARDFLQNIFRASPEAIIVTDAYGYIIMANESVYDVYGYLPEELVGQHVSVLAPDDDAMMQKTFTMMDELFEKGVVHNFMAERRRKDGRILQTESSIVQMKNADGTPAGGISSSRDISERKRFEEQLRQALDYFETLFRASPDAIYVTDAEGYIVKANESFYSVYGYHPEEIIGQHAAVLTPEEEKAQQAGIALMEELFERGIVRTYPGERQRKDGRIIQVESSAVLLKNSDGTPSGAISSSRDITDRKRLEEQLRQSQKMEAVGTLAGGIAHDFNNILGVIFGYAELSQDLAAGNSVLENNLAQILKAADRAKNLVSQILAFSRKSESDVKPLRAHLVIKEALKLLRASLPSTISIITDIDGTHDIVVADATQLHQIIMNLCTNASYAMQHSGGALEVKLKPLDIDENSVKSYGGLEPGPYVQLSVRDTGTGIPADIIGRIFEPFFTTKDVGRGTGMGLSVVHGIVKSLKGDIKVYSEPGRGSVFHVVLPRVQEAVSESSMGVQEVPLGHESVLLVDDEMVLLDVGTQMLGSLGYRVTALQSPLEALEMFRKNPAWFDLVITDQTMPQLTGYELAQQFMQLRPDIPVILCTGYSDLVTAESALAGGIKAFVIKPLNRLALAETIRKVLDKERRIASRHAVNVPP